jgi:hypothetical protein
MSNCLRAVPQSNNLSFDPPGDSLNLLERWFAELTTRKLRRFAHRSVTALEAEVRRWINEWNAGRRIAGLTAGHPAEAGGADHRRLRRGPLVRRGRGGGLRHGR